MTKKFVVFKYNTENKKLQFQMMYMILKKWMKKMLETWAFNKCWQFCKCFMKNHDQNLTNLYF